MFRTSLWLAQIEVDFCSSASTSRTFFPDAALRTVRFVAIVVLPVPPFTPPTTTIIEFLWFGMYIMLYKLYSTCTFVVQQRYINRIIYVYKRFLNRSSRPVSFKLMQFDVLVMD